MIFNEDQLFHIYNQGNNKTEIFFSDENYSYFLWKMKAYLLPFGDLVSWCLMPNHFHWQFYVNRTEIERFELRKHVNKTEEERRAQDKKSIYFGPKYRGEYKANDENPISLNESIGILMRSYTNAINRAYGRTGSLFRQGCKAKCGWLNQFITLGDLDYFPYELERYLNYDRVCFDYIHNNPVKGKLVKNATDYPWSSAREYEGLSEECISNVELGKALM